MLVHGTGQGEWRIAADCTFKAYVDGEEHARGVIVDDGNGYFGNSHVSGNTIIIVERKVHSQ